MVRARGRFRSLLLLPFLRAAAIATASQRMRVGNQDTPVTRVVSMLKAMSKTLGEELAEDEELHGKLACWCSENKHEKEGLADASEQKIAGLESDVESLTAKMSELKSSVAELEDELKADRQALDEATALRDKQLREAHSMETDGIQAIESLRAAILVLEKHEANEGGPVFKTDRDSWSALLALAAGRPAVAESKLRTVLRAGLKPEQAAIVSQGLKAASAFFQSRGAARGRYYPAYASQSGTILGILRQMKDDMEADLSKAQQLESKNAADFSELREAKREEIGNGADMAGRKKEALAGAHTALVQTKDDLSEERASLTDSQRFLKNLKEKCDTAESDFAERQAARVAEQQALAEAVGILQTDEARDAMSGTFSFLEFGASSARSSSARVVDRRRAAANLLRRTALASKNPDLAALATRTELDAFTRVKKAIDDMVAILKTQQADEVKKSDWCKAEFHGNDVTTTRLNASRSATESRIAELAGAVETLETEIKDGQAQMAQAQLDLQQAGETRKSENMEFQKTVSDQIQTQEALRKALDRLKAFYDAPTSLVQTRRARGLRVHHLTESRGQQTPPMQQMEYSKSEGASGVIQLLNKLITEARILIQDSRKSEQNAQTAYEALISDTNAAVATLQTQAVTKTKAKALHSEDKHREEANLVAMVREIEGVSNYEADLHVECDFVLRNFQARQQARLEEIDAMNQAKAILSGAASG